MELRYITRTTDSGQVTVLQYRTEKPQTDYSALNPVTGGHITKMFWSEWQDVQTVTE